ncbi:MAG: UDP-4-amino-4,6-dideoxy-N-acetyl-beta-L-altrosamine transaminase [Candidatus Omnitrophica bacterium]|nr:UDP-4-amino-4,6-dideoxy-N-acetyl-beta-L-altrosamine transaminase [Candidatus Omnitrophota bacterium]MBU1808948.1 UDP-4-amino-4,6-dideoxy-N-acetyl-beta-L-altrosamine transaminase [Candidatus Omnitrophota bacterium]
MKNIPYGRQSVDRSDIAEAVKVLRSDWLTQGPKIAEFEKSLCAYTGAKYAVAVSSGTAALHIASLAAGLKCGDEAITSPITFVASANCALYCGARPVFADISPDTANIDPDEVSKRITRRTKVIIPIHFAGHPCDLSEIAGIARKKKIMVIEDAAHAIGAEYKGSKIGSCKYSDMTIFSFHPVKTITTGEGGAVLTNSGKLHRALLLFRNHGITKDISLMDRTMRGCGWYYEMHDLGFNYRITDIQAALGVSQLKKADQFVEKRRSIAALYNDAFAGNQFFDTPDEKKEAYSACHLYPIRLKDGYMKKRKDIFASLRSRGVGVQVHYIPVHTQPYYRKLGYKRGACPNAEDYYSREISLPIYPALKAAQARYVIDTIFKICGRI